eukprot:CAMPEP_0116013680 /NCGR_PEP_ID=MMETSP0321-20121206/5861_1 /TAXON_ID=163516 /ORGANISM="Leptocylindrus danicus var. danicus, Strain B650" /LENGTH=693 /DNA_ID=CAMNT_0003483257 /DNA_START=120 /DNA_END=2198 /DNA_ORIENTATION=+
MTKYKPPSRPRHLLALLPLFLCCTIQHQSVRAQNDDNYDDGNENGDTGDDKYDDAATGGEYTERDVLNIFYESTNGDTWNNNNNWYKDNTEICDWHGVECDDEDYVVKVSLPANNVSGHVPHEFWWLPRIEELNLSNNNVQFKFGGMQIGESKTIRRLNLSNNALTDLDGIEQLHHTIEELDFSLNAYSGTIPDRIWELTSLTKLYLDRNEFTGTLPPEIGNLENIQSFDLFGNSLTGTIPAEIGFMTSIRDFEISQNSFSGSIPWNMLQNMAGSLTGFYCHHNNELTGAVPDFAGLPNLLEVYIGHNKFTGTIPATFFQDVPTGEKNLIVHMESNQITGSVPVELARFDSIDFRVDGNRIESLASDFCSKTEWMNGLVERYGCDAILCKPGEGNDAGREDATDNPCHLCDGNELSAYWGNTNCDVSAQVDKERAALKLFYQTCGGTDWIRQHGWLDSDVDICEWEGIGCHETGIVDRIMMGANNIVGTPPSALFTDLPHLSILSLYSNPIDFKFDGIASARRLHSLLLDSTGLESVDGLGDAAELMMVDMRFNKISDPKKVSDEISKLKKLNYFDMSDNHLSGGVPQALYSDNVVAHTIRLARNNLSGSVPSFENHHSLHTIDLSGNQLSGSIPQDFLANVGENHKLTINLSSNKISGGLPVALSRFSTADVYLRNNKLEHIDPLLCSQEEW